MKIINGCRRSGKSYKILEKLTERDLFITFNQRTAGIAYKEWIEIHKPKKIDLKHKVLQDIKPTFVTFNEIKMGNLLGYQFEHIYIDDLDNIIIDILLSYHVRFSDDISCTTGAEIELLPIPEDVKKILAEHPEVDFIGNTTVKTESNQTNPCIGCKHHTQQGLLEGGTEWTCSYSSCKYDFSNINPKEAE